MTSPTQIMKRSAAFMAKKFRFSCFSSAFPFIPLLCSIYHTNTYFRPILFFFSLQCSTSDKRHTPCIIMDFCAFILYNIRFTRFYFLMTFYSECIWDCL